MTESIILGFLGGAFGCLLGYIVGFKQGFSIVLEMIANSVEIKKAKDKKEEE